jgi:hypothetical protein
VVLDFLGVVVAFATVASLPTLTILILFGDDLRSVVRGFFRRGPVEYEPPEHLFTDEDESVRIPIEKIAADLRRLARARRLAASGSVREHAVTTVYDRRLAQACRSLELEHALVDTDGLDHELERLRVEAALTRAGLVLTTAESELDV